MSSYKLPSAAVVITVCLIAILTLSGCAKSQTGTSTTYPSNEEEAVEYFTLVESLRGQLQATRSLVDLGYFDRGAVHLDRPVDEIFSTISEKARLQAVSAPFLIDLRNWQTYFARQYYDKSLLIRQHNRVLQSFNAIADIPAAKERISVRVQLAVVKSLLAQVGQHYRDAVQNDLVVSPTDFETARGLLEAVNEEVFQPSLKLLRRVNPLAAQQMGSSMAEVLSVIPTPVLSGITPSEFSRIETAIANFNRAADSVF
ncbi:hypothetical protein [Leptolyngbya ohadii]|uniref:hypothetical protein n=1 Tax=Leptolyngbya ohadii TaxID=1962290 RepID=UPI000B59BEDA|nr:hypothetical protein [Leptolyngbya ohadii]